MSDQTTNDLNRMLERVDAQIVRYEAICQSLRDIIISEPYLDTTRGAIDAAKIIAGVLIELHAKRAETEWVRDRAPKLKIPNLNGTP